MEEKIANILERYAEIETSMSSEEVVSDPSRLKALAKEHSSLWPIVECSRKLEAVRKNIAGNRQLIAQDSDQELVLLAEEELSDPGLLLASERTMGNGVVDTIRDIVYVKPDLFEAGRTREIAAEIAEINALLMDEARPYLLIGFGRWGSSDPWLGIQVDWGQICGAKVIVEATLPHMNVEASQGAHFFHNITSFRVSYLTVHHAAQPGIDWDWLAALPAVRESGLVRHVRPARPLLVKVDGRTGRGAVWRERGL